MTEADRFIERWLPYAMVMVRRMHLGLPGADLEDVEQEVRIGIWNAYRNWRPESGSSVASFVTLCVRRHLYTKIKQYSGPRHAILNKAPRVLPLEDGGEVDAVEACEALGSDPAEVLAARLEAREFLAVIAGASKLEREAARLRVIGASYAEIAEQQCCSVKRIDNALQRTGRKVAERLAA